MAPNQSTETRQRQRRRRRPCPATAIALVAALATTTSPSSPFFAHANHPSSIKKNQKHPKKHPPKIRGGSWPDAAVAAEGGILGSSDNSNGGGGNGNNRVVIVQPDSIAHSRQSSQSQSQSGTVLEQQHQQQGDVQIHPWPHPDTFQDGQQNPQQKKSQPRGNSDWAGERATYGQKENAYGQQGNVEYYQNGQPLQSSHTADSVTNSDSTSYEQWLQTHQTNGQAFQSSYSNNDDNPNTDYEEWLQAQSSAKAQSSAHVASYTQKQPQARGETQSHNSDSTSYEQWLQTQSQGQPRGQPLQSSAGQPTYQEWKQQQAQQQAQGSAASSTNDQLQGQVGGQPLQQTYQEWLYSEHERLQSKKQQQAQAQGSAVSSINDQPLEAKPESKSSPPLETLPKSKLSTPLEDLDVVSGKQVILRPRLNNDVVDSNSKQSILPPMGSASSSPSNNNDGINDQQPVVYYYDPRTLQSSSSSTNNNNEMDAPELTLPEIVYTSSGHALKLEQVHAGGRNEVFLEVRPKAVWGSDFSKSGWNDRLTSLQEKLQNHSSNGGSSDSSGSGGNRPQSQDQLIVLFTVATMAVMVGALSAKRLRSKKLLESCMHPELDEDWDEDFNISVAGSGAGAAPRYDKKFDVDTGRSVASTAASPNGSGSTGLNSSGGFGALLGGRNKDRVRYYGTDNENAGMGGGGGLHWRGDMEKFDV